MLGIKEITTNVHSSPLPMACRIHFILDSSLYGINDGIIIHPAAATNMIIGISIIVYNPLT